jgi:molybdopterin/thiamine biosynthesis adenylyltransferase
MSQALINRSPDLVKLQNEDYRIEVCGGYLTIHHIPYLNKNREIKSGTLVMALTTSGNIAIKPQDHTAYFIGEQPCNIDGTIVTSLVNSPQKQNLYANIVSDFYLSCHPDNRDYADYYDKVTTYYNIISSPAINLDAEACRRLKKPLIISSENSPLVYTDTNASRANIAYLNDKFYPQKIAIVGAGGTGSYILDFVSKTPVAEIHLFDADVFNTHNAFRTPGAASVEELEQQLFKVEYLSKKYSQIHKGIIRHKEYITQDNIDSLKNMSYVFLYIDKMSVRNAIAGYLIENEIPFINSGLGINLSGNQLDGMVEITTAYKDHYSHIKDVFSGNDVKNDDMYASNIQIAELNAMAAIYSIIKWKKMLGFYHDVKQEVRSVYSINDNDMYNEKE